MQRRHHRAGHGACRALRVLDLQVTLLKRAADIAGGYERLCMYLGVSEVRCELWRRARLRVPDPVFLKLVDLVLQDDLARAADDRRRQPRRSEVRAEAHRTSSPSSHTH